MSLPSTKEIKTTKQIRYKYDLMHLNTPSFASAVITWDMSKASKVITNKVIKWFRQGYTEHYGGQAKAIWHELRSQLEIPYFKLKIAEKPGRDTFVEWDHLVEGSDLYKALNEIYINNKIALRLEGKRNWYCQTENLDVSRGYIYFEYGFDYTKVQEEAKKMLSTPEVKDKIEKAIHFIESGGKLTFNWR